MWEVIKMLINLVKKDLLLAKKYLIIMFIFAIAAPIYVQLNSGGGLASFFVTVIICLTLHNSLYQRLSG